MSKNLAILSYIHNIFNDFVDTNSKLKLNKLIPNHKNFKFEGVKGDFILEDSHLYVQINKSKIAGKYEILNAGYSIIYDININNFDIKNNKIPNFNLLTHSTNNPLFIQKIIRILNLSNKYKICDNSFNSFNLSNIIELYLLDTNELIDQKENLLKGRKSDAFYFKIYSDHSKAFYINGKTNTIFYIDTIEDYNNGRIQFTYFFLNIDDKLRLPVV